MGDWNFETWNFKNQIFKISELESTLVALIPVNDERLKPRKTSVITPLQSL